MVFPRVQAAPSSFDEGHDQLLVHSPFLDLALKTPQGLRCSPRGRGRCARCRWDRSLEPAWRMLGVKTCACSHSF